MEAGAKGPSWGAVAPASGATAPPRRLAFNIGLDRRWVELAARVGRYASAPMDAELADKVALVTGAGSPTGIGFATARILGREGAALALCSTTERIHERAAELHGGGMRSAGFVADLTDRAQVREMVDAVVEAFGRIDVLVNNAGMVHVGMDGQPGGPFLDLSDADWDLDLRLNLETAYAVTRAAVPGMEAYNADHSTGYTGVTLTKLQGSYDAGIKNIKISVANATLYCIRNTIPGTATYHKTGPSGDIKPGGC